mmetsp:Transcript_6344/g.17042  ORF Transcript_6344/g.17042 Transcript_6344/m.17042 type:complete len:210 (-) Transcript_6344:924-1553(-)
MEGAQPALDQAGQVVEGVAIAVEVLVGQVPPLVRQLQGEHEQRDDLPRKGLRRGHPDLWPRVQVDARVRLARDARAHDVHNSDGDRLELLGYLDRLQCVCRLAALGDGQDDVLGIDKRAAVAELARVLNLHRQARELLDGILCDHAGVERGPAGTDDDPVGRCHLLHWAPSAVHGVLGDLLQTPQLQPPGARFTGFAFTSVQPAPHGIP